MDTIINTESLIRKVRSAVDNNKLDLSSDEDLSIAIMNLISIEEHLFYTSQKTGKSQYLDLLNEVRILRTELMKKIIKDYEGEVWCISKHLLAASMRVMEVGTKELKKGNKKEAQGLFEKSFNLYSLFWGINLNTTLLPEGRAGSISKKISLIDEKGKERGSESIFSKLGQIVKKAVDCCRE